MSEVDALLFCRTASRLCALPIVHVIETLRPLPIEPFEGAPAFVLGIARVRGMPVPVVDVGRLLGDGGGALRRFVTVRAGARTVALAFGSVLGVHAGQAVALSDPPPLLGEAGGDRIAALGTLDGALLVVLESARLVPDSLWASLARAQARS